MATLGERASHRVRALRERHPAVDHTVGALSYYSLRNGNAHAGAVTYFGFLSFFPLLALAFFAIGYVSAVAPEARGELVDAIESIFPGLIGPGEDQISLDTFEEYAGASVSIGLVGLLYTGLGWVSAMRRALGEMFCLPVDDRLPFVRGKVRDLGMLVVLGLVLVASVSLSGALTWFWESILEGFDLEDLFLAQALLWVVTHGLGIAVTTLLLMTIFALVPKPQVPRRSLWRAALLGAVGFEVLKSAAGALVAVTVQRPSFQAFGVALILVLWINFFSRLVMLSAAWAYTAPETERVREHAARPLVEGEEAEELLPEPATVSGEDTGEDAEPPERPGRMER
ncbi:MAG TPA: YihY/virulence factor BrkB family protein [Nocardioidaceae bacterium]